MKEKINSIFRLTIYEYSRHSLEKLRYPIKLSNYKSTYFNTLEEAEYAVMHKACFADKSQVSEHKFYGTYAFVITEIPLGINVSLDNLGDSLSERIYLPNGSLWGVRDFCNFIPTDCHGEEFNYWGRLNRFHGRALEDIRFKPGDIVEVFGFSGNRYWNNEEVNLAIVVKCPPTKKEVSDFLDEYLATHTGFDVCEHNLSAKFGYGEDVYLVLSEACDALDYAPTISLFSPSIKVSKQREKKLKLLYEKYLINQMVKR
jgi:hypothetical protein